NGEAAVDAPADLAADIGEAGAEVGRRNLVKAADAPSLPFMGRDSEAKPRRVGKSASAPALGCEALHRSHPRPRLSTRPAPCSEPSEPESLHEPESGPGPGRALPGGDCCD